MNCGEAWHGSTLPLPQPPAGGARLLLCHPGRWLSAHPASARLDRPAAGELPAGAHQISAVRDFSSSFLRFSPKSLLPVKWDSGMLLSCLSVRWNFSPHLVCFQTEAQTELTVCARLSRIIKMPALGRAKTSTPHNKTSKKGDLCMQTNISDHTLNLSRKTSFF